MNSTTLICKRCKAPLEYEEGSAVLRCPHCGYTEKIDESDEITRERIRAKAYTDTELGKSKIEKDASIEEKKLHLEEKSLGIKKVKYIFYAILVVIMAGLIAFAVYEIQHKGKIYIKQASDFYIGMDYQNTHRLLEEAGFERIKDSPQATLSKKELALVGKVIGVSIDGNPSFVRGWFPKDAAVSIYYGILDPERANDIRMPFSNPDCIGVNYQIIADKLSAEGFKNIKLISYPDLTMDHLSQDGKITRITINDSESFLLGEYYSANSIIQIDYHVLDPERVNDIRMTLSWSDCIGRSYQIIADKLSEEGFNSIKTVPYADLSMDCQSEVGKIVRITINKNEKFKIGEYFPADSIIQIDYHTLDPERMTDVMIPADYDSLTEIDYLEACKEFIAAGFSNITLIPKYDVGLFESSKSGIVQSITVNGKNAFDKGVWMPLNTEVRITYRTKEWKYVGEQFQDVQKRLSSVGFSKIGFEPLNDLEISEMKLAGDVVSVLINNTEFDKATELNLLSQIIIQYHSERQAEADQVKITKASKDLTGEKVEDVISALKKMGFETIKEIALEDLSNEIIHKSGSVSEVSIGGITKFSVGEIYEKAAEVIVTYHSLKPKPLPSPESQPKAGQIQVTISSKDLNGENYQTVITMLQKMGFSNVKANSLNDLSKGWIYKDGTVKSVSIGGLTKFSVGDVFNEDVEIIIYYHSFP